MYFTLISGESHLRGRHGPFWKNGLKKVGRGLLSKERGGIRIRGKEEIKQFLKQGLWMVKNGREP